MKLMMIAAVVAGVAMCGLLWAGDAPKAGTVSIGELKKVLELNLSALNAGNVEKSMTAVHPKSRAYQGTLTYTKSLIASYKLKFTLDSVAFIGCDGEYAVVRAKETCRRLEGPEFKDNQTDTMQIFRKDGNDRKLWQTSILSTRLLQEAASAPAEKEAFSPTGR
jgi:hypothetical protein